jgi:hypothetical protein
LNAILRAIQQQVCMGTCLVGVLPHFHGRFEKG